MKLKTRRLVAVGMAGIAVLAFVLGLASIIRGWPPPRGALIVANSAIICVGATTFTFACLARKNRRYIAFVVAIAIGFLLLISGGYGLIHLDEIRMQSDEGHFYPRASAAAECLFAPILGVLLVVLGLAGLRNLKHSTTKSN
jgi:hypothetical protein